MIYDHTRMYFTFHSLLILYYFSECDASRELPNARLPRHEATDSKISKETTYRHDYIPQMEMKSPPSDV